MTPKLRTTDLFSHAFCLNFYLKTKKKQPYICSLSDDFLGASSSSQFNVTPPSDNTSTRPPMSATTETSLLTPVLSPGEERDATLSVSSDSVSLPTQVDMQPQPAVTELANQFTAASLEEESDKATQAEQKSGKSDLTPDLEVTAVSPTEPSADKAPVRPSAPKPTAAKEDGPQDLRVFELNSDSGKSTPSNNGKKGRIHFSLPSVNVGESCKHLSFHPWITIYIST